MKEIKPIFINGYRTYPFKSVQELLEISKNDFDGAILVALNAEKLITDNKQLKKIINTNIGYPDGIGAVMALRRKGHIATRLPGADLWLSIIANYYESKSFYIVGGTENVIKSTIQQLTIDFPGINIVNHRNGYLKKGEEVVLVNDIADKGPDIVFVAMGSPRQELLMEKMLDKHKALYMGLGGSFDVYTGAKKRAPVFLQKMGMEWSYRLIKEPSRIYRQRKLIPFFYKLLFNKL